MKEKTKTKADQVDSQDIFIIDRFVVSQFDQVLSDVKVSCINYGQQRNFGRAMGKRFEEYDKRKKNKDNKYYGIMGDSESSDSQGSHDEEEEDDINQVNNK